MKRFLGVIILLFSTIGFAQSNSNLPVTIKTLKSVTVVSRPRTVEMRGLLFISSNHRPFVIKKGETFKMISIGSEGGCRIRYRGSEYEVSSCPWLDGFADHQADFFKVLN